MFNKRIKAKHGRVAVKILVGVVVAATLVTTGIGGAAASPSDVSANSDTAMDKEHPQGDKEQDHQRQENYDGGVSDVKAIGGLATACQTPASNGPEASTWCQQ